MSLELKFLFLLVFIPVLALRAVDNSPAEPNEYMAIGLATAVSSSPYIDDDSRVIPLPLFTYITERFYFTGLETGYALLGNHQLSLLAIAGARMEYYSEDDSYIFEDMDNRHLSLDGGFKVRSEQSWVVLEGGWKADLLSVYDGYEYFAEAKRSFRGVFDIEKLDINVTAGLNWRSDNLNDYYFGVEPDEGTPARPAYQSGGGINYQLGIGWVYQLSDRWSLFNSYQAEFLSDEIADSPLVDTDTIYSTIVGLSYQLNTR